MLFLSMLIGSSIFISGLSELLIVGMVVFMSLLVFCMLLGEDGFSFVGWGVVSDDLSLLSVGLTLWIGLLIMSSGKKGVLFKGLMFFILLILSLCFSSSEILWFYIYFELVLIPMLLVILVYGPQPERLESGFYMMFYTSAGSLPLLVMVVYISGSCGGGSFMFMFFIKSEISMFEGLFMVSAFLIKLPSYGFHIWLPKAHVEAPVEGSMILAGVLLKLGGYGLLRFLPYVYMSMMLKGVLVFIGLWGGVYSSFLCLRQLDMKKLVAYSSVVHSGFMLGGILSGVSMGWGGSLMSMLGHGFCSSGLFFLVNLIYVRLFSRSLLIVKGSGGLDPSSMLWMFLLIVANSAAPPFLSFFSEVGLSMGIISEWSGSSLMVSLSLFSSVTYGMYFYSVLAHGKYDNFVFNQVKVSEYLILFLHFIPLLLLIFKLDFYVG